MTRQHFILAAGFAAILPLGFGLSCATDLAGGGGSGTPSLSTGQHPDVVFSTPADGATGVAVDTTISIEFARAVDPESIDGGIDPEVEYEFSWSEGNTVITVTPAAELAPGTTYTVTVASLTFADGSVLSPPCEFSFTVAGPDDDQTDDDLTDDDVPDDEITDDDTGVDTDEPSEGDDINAPATLSGTVNARSVTIPAGHTTEVTDDLDLEVTGDVVIDGELIARDRADGDGFSITINVEGDIDIGGTIQAGAGTAGGGQVLAKASGDDDLAGHDGGFVELFAGGNLTLHAEGRLAAGDGGLGGSGELGGDGGQGGDLRLGADGTLLLQGMMVVGNGGNSGESTPLELTGEDGAAIGGAGGDSGELFLKASAIDLPGYSAEEHSIEFFETGGVTWHPQFEGGIGGSAGTLYWVDVPLTSSQTRSVDDAWVLSKLCTSGNSVCVYEAPSGGNGFILGGGGAWILVKDSIIPHGQERDIVVTGGRGGDLQRSQHPFFGMAAIPSGARAGDGGYAQAWAGSGEDGTVQDLNGVHGASAWAEGGRGGHAAVNLLQYGGKGGDAMACGGEGGSGRDSCTVPGNGGNGGRATAIGGSGGNGGFPGSGGKADATGGQGGEGGSGGPQVGSGGQGGSATATGGAPGTAGTRDFGAEPKRGLATVEDGDDGDPGIKDLFSGPWAECPD